MLLTALFGGASAAFALSYVLHEQVANLWWIILFWGLTLANIDRLLLLISGSGKMILAMLPRLLISLLLGFLIAEPLTLRIFQPEINVQIAATQQQAQKAQLNVIDKTYQPKIANDQRKISELDNQRANDQQRIDYWEKQAGCEAQEITCSATHKLGCGPICRYDLVRAAAARAAYRQAKPQIVRQIAVAQDDGKMLISEQATAERQAHGAIANGAGWAARENALDQLAAMDAPVKWTVWLVRLAFILVDLAPLVLKFLMVVFGEQKHYSAFAKAIQDQEMLAVHEMREQTRIRRNAISRRAEADDEIDEAVVEADRDQRIAAAYGEVPGVVRRPRRRADPVSSVSLSTFVEGSRHHEGMAVPITRPLALVAWIGTGLLVLLTAGLLVTRAGHVAISGIWIILAVLTAVLAGTLAIYSHGFRRGSAWTQRAAFGTGLLGLALPVLIIAFNA